MTTRVPHKMTSRGRLLSPVRNAALKRPSSCLLPHLQYWVTTLHLVASLRLHPQTSHLPSWSRRRLRLLWNRSRSLASRDHQCSTSRVHHRPHLHVRQHPSCRLLPRRP